MAGPGQRDHRCILASIDKRLRSACGCHRVGRREDEQCWTTQFGGRLYAALIRVARGKVSLQDFTAVSLRDALHQSQVAPYIRETWTRTRRLAIERID